METERRRHIINTVKDIVLDFLSYHRKEDQQLPEGAIEAAIAAGEISQDEIVELFREELTRMLSHYPYRLTR